MGVKQFVRSGPVLAALIALSCGPETVEPIQPGTAHDLPIIQDVGYMGVIFPETMAEQAARSLGIETSGVWTPDPTDVARAESGLRAALEYAHGAPESLDPYSTTGERRAWMSRTIAKILEQLPRYRRQYIGIAAADGTRRVLVNCFPGPGVDPPDFYEGWRQGVIAADDGWYRYWRIQYDVNSGRYMQLDSNGGA
jgi:hypothetical protein